MRIPTQLSFHFSSKPDCRGGGAALSANMGLITGLFTFLYHLPQIYKWLLKPYYITSLLLTIAFLVVRKTPGLCEHLASDREDGNSCDFDWVSMWGGIVLLRPCLLLNIVELTTEKRS